MKPTRWAVVATGLAFAATSAATVISIDSASAATGKVVVKTRTISPYGTVLTTSKGRTLYFYSKDSKGKSACNAGCVTYWTPLRVPKGDSVTGVAGLGTIKRSDGSLQAALRGRALYTYVGDSAAGQAKGQNVDGTWFVATPHGASHATAAPAPAPTKSSPPGGGYGY
jgi:predicted lipoprotein with Yx(FWY)xxD motif